RMWFVAQRVQDQYVQAFDQGNRAVGNGAEVRDVGRLAEAKPEHGQVPVQHRKRNQALAPQVKGAVDDVRVELGDAAVGIGLVEDVREDAADVVHRPAAGVDRDRLALAKIEDANVIEPEHVVRVGVGEQ